MRGEKIWNMENKKRKQKKLKQELKNQKPEMNLGKTKSWKIEKYENWNRKIGKLCKIGWKNIKT